LVLARKGADTAVVGTALSLVFAGGAVGKFACGALATKLGILRTVAATELGTALAILALLVLPLSVCLALMPVLGTMLNGTSSVLYGTVPELTPNGHEARAFGFFYTVTIGADAIAPTLYGGVADARSLRHDSAGRSGCLVDPAFARCASARRPRAQTMEHPMNAYKQLCLQLNTICHMPTALSDWHCSDRRTSGVVPVIARFSSGTAATIKTWRPRSSQR
jgi:hypothetical protein